MQVFEQDCCALFERLGDHAKMVLSTALRDHVSSRMMSVIIADRTFYFQTDRTLRKYEQLRENPRAALCMDNLQVEGVCRELGRTDENSLFCALYRRHFPSSYERYTRLANERLFSFTPTYIQKWVYENGKPFTEVFDFTQGVYLKTAYLGT